MKRRHMMKRMVSMFLVMVFIVGMLAGCGGGQTQNSNDGEGAADNNAGEEVVFTFAQSEDIQSTNQFNDNSVINQSIFGLLFDYLINQDHQGEYTPGLIEKWSVSDDGLVWHFTTRKDVTFSDGTAFTVNDIKAGWEYAKSDETLASYSTWSNIDHIDVTDDQNMTVTLVEPDATFLANVATSAYVESSVFDAAKADEYWENPQGCGPYKFVSWDPSNQLVFERNTKYWGELDSNVTKIVFKPISEDITKVSALQTGEVNLILDVPYEQVDKVKNDSNLTYEEMDGSMSLWMGVQCSADSICSDENFRKALSCSLDRELIASGIYGNATPLYWGAPAFSLGYDEAEIGNYFQYDKDLAKDYLKKSGYNGESLKFICPTTWFGKVNEITQTIVSAFGEIGVNVELELLEGAAYATARGNGEYDICLQNYRFSVNNAKWYWLQFVNNYGKYNYSNQEALDLLTSAYRTADEEQSVADLKAGLKLMAEDYAPMLPLLVFATTASYQNEWEGIEIYADNQYDLREVTKAQ